MKILYVDMDNVIVDFKSALSKLPKEDLSKYDGQLDNIPGIFSIMDPIDNAIDSVIKLSSKFDTYLLSTAPWENASAWSDKLHWVKKYFGKIFYKRLILSHHKNLNIGDYLVDDRTANGVDKFKGEHIQFGALDFENWEKVEKYLLAQVE